MAKIKSIDDIARKWATVTPQRVAEYESGVRNPLTDWKTATVAANDAYKDGIQKSLAADRFQKGVSKAGTAKWQEGALTKGVSRWGEGVALAENAFAQGFAPFQAAIASLKLPPRFARRDPRNLARVKAVVDTMIKTAEAQSG